MKKLLLITLCLASTTAQAKKDGLIWKLGRTGIAASVAYQAHKRISDKIADKITDETYIWYKMLRDKTITREAAQKEIDQKQLELKNATGVKPESLVRVLLTLMTFELSKGVLDGYVYDAIFG